MSKPQPVEQFSPARVKRLLQAQIGRAAGELRGRRLPSSKAVHEARKTLKRARASLRLLRDAIGSANYRRENLALRNAARPLSRVRDAQVMRETLERVLEKVPNRARFSRMRAQLRQEQLRARRDLFGSQTRRQIVSALQAAERRVQHWRLPDTGVAVLTAGAERLYRKGRQALARAESERSAQSLHEARKQVKYLGLAMKPLAPFATRHVRAVAEQAEAIEVRLGEDHDLAVLRQQIVRLTTQTNGDNKALLERIEARQAKLRKQALKQGRQLYRRKAASFRRRLQPVRSNPRAELLPRHRG